jgi:hypothetical protein
MEGRFEPRTAGLPFQIFDTAFSQAGALHPLQHVCGAAAVVTHKPGIPDEAKREHGNEIGEKEADHGADASAQKSYF